MREPRFYRRAFGPNCQVFHCGTAGVPRPQPRNGDPGGHHIAFYMDDLDRADVRLPNQGVRVPGASTASRNASGGRSWAYFLSSWGMRFELVRFTRGKSYERAGGAVLWNPARPGA